MGVRSLRNLRKNHHYVSQSYLKAWANNHNRVWTYRTLVSHCSVPDWSLSWLESNKFRVISNRLNRGVDVFSYLEEGIGR